ncbi:MAG: hypothetical protein PHU14_15075 [Methylovulum sp.]|nr:hypothetical protein [Methylovulum sp.]
MKKLLLSLLLALSIPLAVAGGMGGGMGGMGGPGMGGPGMSPADFKAHHAEKMAMMAKELGLTADQQSKVDAIFEQQRVKFQAVHEETKNHLKEVLTPDQFKKFETMHPHHMMPPPPPPKPE